MAKGIIVVPDLETDYCVLENIVLVNEDYFMQLVNGGVD